MPLFLKHTLAGLRRPPEGASGEETAPIRWNRRTFLVAAGASLAASTAGFAAAPARGPTPLPPPSGDAPVAVIGGGLSGLVCALGLAEAGVGVRVYETGQVGGRVRTVGAARIDAYAEHIAASHRSVLGLLNRFAVAMEPVGLPTGAPALFGCSLEADEALSALEALVASLPQRGDPSRAQGLSAEEWIAASVPGGVDSALGRLCHGALHVEVGAHPSEVAAHHLVESLRSATELIFRAPGGLQQLPDAIAAHLGGRVRPGACLEALTRVGDARYELRFVDGPPVAARAVVLAAPPAALARMDLRGAGLSELQHRAIAQVGRGRHAKLTLVQTRAPETLPMLLDNRLQRVWADQSPSRHALTRLVGGVDVARQHSGAALASTRDGAVRRDAADFLAEMRLCGVAGAAAWTGDGMQSQAHLDSRFGASRAYWRPGQRAELGLALRSSVGGVHLAGEACSPSHQGTVEGAVREGLRAAEAILGVAGRRSTQALG